MDVSKLKPGARKPHNQTVDRYPRNLTRLPDAEISSAFSPDQTLRPIAVWRSRKYLVQLYAPKDGVSRLSVNRSTINKNGRWDDGITWDELQRIKRICGFGDHMAVEIYPEDEHVVDVANIRHLWILQDRCPFAWTRENA